MDATVQFLTQHGTIILFLIVLAEQVGLPIPALPVLIAAGALVGAGQMGFWSAVGTAILASLLADQLWFELGRQQGRQVLGWLCRISFEPMSCVRRTEEFFARHGIHSLMIAKFIPGLNTIAPPLAGIMGLRMTQYLLYNGIGTILWAGSGIGLGIVFSNQLDQALAMVTKLGPTVALAFLGMVLGYVVYKALHRYRVEQLVPRLAARQLVEKIAAGENPVIIDLRPHDAREDVPGIPSSLALSLDELLATQHELPRDRDVVLYCACPRDATSVHVAWKLREAGFTRVWPLAGGIEAWHAINREAERNKRTGLQIVERVA
jgi:membrane protein DedA with SNARE-associated domain/rhodanese-related sulfurtransferase